MKLKFVLSKGYVLISVLVSVLFLGCTSLQTKVYFIPSLHGLHQINNNYNYDTLKQIINRLKPDIIAVEIRPEDISQDSTYMVKNYPFEMRMMKYWFPEAKIEGFDWLGGDIEGKTIPNNYWKDISVTKKLERELSADSIYSKKCAVCDTFTHQRLAILKNYSLKEIISSNDSLLTKHFYQCLEKQLTGTRYENILSFYDIRNDKILKNIEEIIKKNKEKVIVIITGYDHYVYLNTKFAHNLLYTNK
jgi:hypothetical protein